MNALLKKLCFYIKPSYIKEKDFNLALSQYLYRELRKHKISVKKIGVLLDISLPNKYKDKYDHLIIDCLDGKLYLRGGKVKDKYCGKLNKFSNGQRRSDAYACATQSIRKILLKLEQLVQNINKQGGVNKNVRDLRVFRKANIRDLRKQINVIDLRNTNVAVNHKVDLRTHYIRDLREYYVGDLRKHYTKDLRKYSKVLRNIIDKRK